MDTIGLLVHTVKSMQAEDRDFSTLTPTQRELIAYVEEVRD